MSGTQRAGATTRVQLRPPHLGQGFFKAAHIGLKHYRYSTLSLPSSSALPEQQPHIVCDPLSPVKPVERFGICMCEEEYGTGDS